MPFLFIVLFSLPVNPAVLSIPPELMSDPIEEAKSAWTQVEVKTYATEIAAKYGLHEQRFLKTIECENGFKAKGQSEHVMKSGEREDSWGAAQINLHWNPSISQEQAEDPSFAIPWMAQEWIKGNANLWSCYNTLYGK